MLFLYLYMFFYYFISQIHFLVVPATENNAHSSVWYTYFCTLFLQFTNFRLKYSLYYRYIYRFVDIIVLIEYYYILQPNQKH